MSLFMHSAALLAVRVTSIALLRAQEVIGSARFADFEFGESISFRGALQSLLEKTDKSSLDVILADEAVKLFVVDPPAGLTRFSDLEATSAVRFEELFGLDASKWRISADWHARRRFMASAAPRWLLAALNENGRKVSCIEPAFVRSYNTLALRERLQWFICRYPDLVTAASFDGAVCQLVRSSMLNAAEPVMPWLEREALLANRPLQQVTLMSSAGIDRNATRGVGEVRLIAPPRHMQLLSALRSSAEVMA